MTWALPAAALVAWLIGAAAVPARRAALCAGGLAVAAWGAAGLMGLGAWTLALPSPLPVLAFVPGGVSGLWLLLLGSLGIALGLLLDDGADGREGAMGRPATASLAHLTLLMGAGVLAAATPFTLLTAWEAMSGLTFLLFLAARPGRRVYAASSLLLLVSEAGAAALYAVVLFSQGAGASVLAALTPAVRLTLALVAVAAFGTKAALVPFQLWLPVAEPEAPGAVAGFLSGALTAVAFAALLRVLGWLDAAALPLGVAVGGLGLAGLSVGALGALFDGDTKRILAFGTVEAMGTAFLALGLGLILRALNAPAQAATALVGAATLVFAHAGGKLCLFAAAGEVEAAGGGRRLDALGGLMARMPWTGATALVGALGLAGVPPLGTFVGEWLLLESLFMPLPEAGGVHVLLALLGAAVAILAALSLTAYLRWYGTAFLGPGRSERALGVTERAGWPRAGLAVALLPLAAAGIATPWLVPMWQSAYAPGPAVILPLFRAPQLNPTLVGVGAAVGRGLPGAGGVVLTPGGGFSVLSPWDLAWIALGVGAIVYLLVRLWAPGMARPPRRSAPWAGGRAAYIPVMTYTAESLNHPLRLSLAAWVGARAERPHILGGRARRYRVRYRDRLWTYGYLLPARVGATLGEALRSWQGGSVAQYVASILLALAVAAIVSSFAR
jgi:hydrogenase-4 component B